MEEVRYGVDRLDEQIVALLAERFRYMEAAARIKLERSAVRDEGRKAQVLDNVRRTSAAESAPIETITAVYEMLIERSIGYEMVRFNEISSRQDGEKL